MYGPSLQHLLIQTHTEEVHRAGQARHVQPIATMGRAAIRKRRRLRLSVYPVRAIERVVGHPAPEAYAF